MNVCTMVEIENADFSIVFECSYCLSLFNPTNKFMDSKACRKCKAEIESFEYIEEEE